AADCRLDLVGSPLAPGILDGANDRTPAFGERPAEPGGEDRIRYRHIFDAQVVRQAFGRCASILDRGAVRSGRTEAHQIAVRLTAAAGADETLRLVERRRHRRLGRSQRAAGRGRERRRGLGGILRDLLTVLHAQWIASEEVLVATLAGESVAIFRSMDAREFAHRRRTAHRGELLLFE